MSDSSIHYKEEDRPDYNKQNKTKGLSYNETVHGPKTFADIAYSIGELVTKKNAAYGNSFAKTGDFLKLLYPKGISVEQYDDALLLVRIFDKMIRIATDKDAFGESPFQDIT